MIKFCFHFFQSPTSNCFTFSFFFLFSSQWLHLRLTFSWAAPHVSRAVAIQRDYCCACLFHQCKTVKIFTKIGIFRPAIYFCKKVLNYQILTEDLAKISIINSQIVLLKDHKPATSVVSYKVTSNLLHLSNFVKSALHGSVPSPLRHSRALCQAGKPLQKHTAGTSEGLTGITSANCFPVQVKKEWRLQCLPGRAS